MSGHSKWSSIKHKKAAADSRRGKIFTRYIREITFAARAGGGDPESNSALRHAIDGAKSVNMPSDNIKKAIQRGTGESEGANYEQITYEGYGPGGVAILVETLTDNKNRTVAEIRYTFAKYNGNLGENGCVSWMFSRKGMIMIEQGAVNEDELLELVLENGAEDMKSEDEAFVVYTSVEDYSPVIQAVKEKKIPILSTELAMIPSTHIKLQGKQAQQMLKLAEKLEDLDDVQDVWANFDISGDEIDEYETNN
jgi:YebC/PmpR family DNA-binding regulatory protein